MRARITRFLCALAAVLPLGAVLVGGPASANPPVLVVEIDIQPGGIPNSINPTNRRGVIAVGIIGSADFDVLDVDVTTLAFGPAAAAPRHKQGGHLENVNDDAYTDLVSHYLTQETGIDDETPGACVTGELLDGTPFEGCDGIRPVPCGIGPELALALPAMMWIYGRRRRAVR